MTKQIGYYKSDWYIMGIDGKYNNACISHTESQLRYTVQGRQNGQSTDWVLLTLENMDLKIILNSMVLYSMIWSGGDENAIRVTFM